VKKSPSKANIAVKKSGNWAVRPTTKVRFAAQRVVVSKGTNSKTSDVKFELVRLKAASFSPSYGVEIIRASVEKAKVAAKKERKDSSKEELPA